MAAIRTPTVRLLLNGQDVPNQVIRPNERIRISITADPPLDPAGEYSLNPMIVPPLVRAGGRNPDMYRTDASHEAPLEIGVQLLRGSQVETTVTKQIYVPQAFPPELVIEAGGHNAPSAIRQGQPLNARLANVDLIGGVLDVRWRGEGATAVTESPEDATRATIATDRPGLVTVIAELWGRDERVFRGSEPFVLTADVEVEPVDGAGSVIPVALQRSSAPPTDDQALWSLIRQRTGEISSTNYIAFVDQVLCAQDFTDVSDRLVDSIRGLTGYGTSSYDVLKLVTELFLLTRCGTFDAKGVNLREESARLGETVSRTELTGRIQNYLGGGLPYLNRVIEAAFPDLEETDNFLCEGLIRTRVQSPCLLELIWSYWHEEGMLVQGMNAVTRRFQNVRGPGPRDPLAHFELDPLRPLNNVLWGYVQDERNRLSVQRRAYEFDHQYGLALLGKAVSPMRPADSRSKFLEAFHSLLNLVYVFYKEDSDTTVIADGYPLLNALKEVHMILAQGAHNQFGDLPWTARVEMLIQQWMFARPEMRDFLQSRPMVPYKEPWMPQVDTLKTLQGWSDVSVTHFSDLGIYGEQILLSIRYGDWIAVNDENSAKNWARYWRPEVQSYIHAYRAVTGVDLTYPEGVDAILPAIHLHKRLLLQHSRGGPELQRTKPALARPRLF